MGVPVAAWASGGIEDWHGPARVAWGDLAGLSARLRALAKGQAVDAPPRLPNEASSMARLFREYLTISGLKGDQDSV